MQQRNSGFYSSWSYSSSRSWFLNMSGTINWKELEHCSLTHPILQHFEKQLLLTIFFFQWTSRAERCRAEFQPRIFVSKYWERNICCKLHQTCDRTTSNTWVEIWISLMSQVHSREKYVKVCEDCLAVCKDSWFRIAWSKDDFFLSCLTTVLLLLN